MNTSGERQSLVIVTGGLGFLGNKVMNEFITNGWQAVSISSSHKATALPAYANYVCDVTESDSVRGIMQEITSKFGKVDAIIHCASTKINRSRIIDTSAESLKITAEVALLGIHNVVVSALPFMSDRGSIIGVTSQATQSGGKIQPMGGYIPSKYAMEGYLRVLASELFSRGIRVNAVAPGFLPGGLNDDLPDKVKEYILSKLSAQETSPQTVASVIFECVTDANRFANGTIIDPLTRTQELL